MHPSSYEKEFVVETYFSDFQSTLTVSGMLRCAQSIATEHIGRLGFGEDVLEKKRCAFLLSKVAVDIFRPLKSGEGMRLKTTAYAPERIFYPRVTEFYTKDGEKSAIMTAQWLFVDTDKRRILRSTGAIDGFPFNEGKVRYDFSIPADGEFECAGTAYARYSMIDRYCHVNNAAYADIVMDILGDKLFQGARQKRFLISYSRQAEIGAEIELHRHKTLDIVRGCVGGALCFEAAAEFI